MKNYKHLVLKSLLCFLLLPGRFVAAEQFQLFATEFPPFNYTTTSGRIVGLSVDIVKELFKRAGLEYSIVIQPQSRAAHSVATTANSGLLTRPLSVIELNDFHWVGPLASHNWVLVGRNGQNFNLSDVSDASNYRVGAVRGSRVATFLWHSGVQADLVSDEELNLLKLQRGRIDLWATADTIFPHVAGESRKELAIKHEFGARALGLALHRDVPVDIVDRLNALLDEMHADGSIEGFMRVNFIVSE